MLSMWCKSRVAAAGLLVAFTFAPGIALAKAPAKKTPAAAQSEGCDMPCCKGSTTGNCCSECQEHMKKHHRQAHRPADCPCAHAKQPAQGTQAPAEGTKP